jgi:hypothetical protein
MFSSPRTQFLILARCRQYIALLEFFLAEGGFGKGTDAPFQSRDVTTLFQAVKEGDDSTTIKKVDRRKLAIPSPNSGGRTDTLEPEAEDANRGEVGVCGANTVPVCVCQVSEGGVHDPRVFHTENFTAGGSGGSSKVERDVIRGGTSRGGKGGIWQRKTPVLVD